MTIRQPHSKPHHRKPPRVVHVTAYPPTGRRTRWAGIEACPKCRSGHLMYAKTRDGLAGARNTPCGPVYAIVDRVVFGIETVPGEARAA